VGQWVQSCPGEAPPETGVCDPFIWVDVAPTVAPFDLATLPIETLGQWWASGFAIVVGFWMLAKSVGVVLQAIKRW